MALAAQGFERRIHREGEISKADLMLFESAAIEREFEIEERAGDGANFPGGEREAEVERFAVAEGEAVFAFEANRFTPAGDIVMDREFGDDCGSA